MSGAPRIKFYELCAYISLGVPWKVYFRRVLRVPRRQGILLWVEYGLEYVLADGVEWLSALQGSGLSEQSTGYLNTCLNNRGFYVNRQGCC
jgi:hypothetical protein